MTDKIILNISGVNKHFGGVKALTDVNFSLRTGEIHALLGQNGAGKTTLMNIIGGNIAPDSGNIVLDEKEVRILNPQDAKDHGISFVHQELNLFSKMSIAENLFITDFPTSIKICVNHKKCYKATEDALKILGIKLNPKNLIKNLSFAEQQLIEIIKALITKPKILILDEPTSSLSESEVEVLFSKIKEIKSLGNSIIYITHRIDEIFKIADTVTILRDGKNIITKSINETNKDEIITLMIGRSLEGKSVTEEVITRKNIVLKVENISEGNKLKGISFELSKNEILGIVGLLGAGKTEIFNTIMGLMSKTNGNIYINNQKIDKPNIRKMIKNGIVYITENRGEEGLFKNLQIKFNITSVILERIKKWIKGLINLKDEIIISKGIVKDLDIQTNSIERIVNTLSGGNQQKVIIGKWLVSKPEILIMDDPTKGIDVGTKFEIYKLIRNLSNEGKAILWTSSDIEEVIDHSDRILILSKGVIKCSLNKDEISLHKVNNLILQ